MNQYTKRHELAKRDQLQERGAYGRHGDETNEKRARRLFDEQARNVGRELVNYMKFHWPDIFVGKPSTFELSIVNHVRNDINWRMRPLLMAMIAMHQEWEAERDCPPEDDANG